MGQTKKEMFLGRAINAIALIFFPIWWLVPSAMILGDSVLGNNPAYLIISAFIAAMYNLLYAFILRGVFDDGRGRLCGPTYSCEDGWHCEPECMTSLPPKHDVGYGLSIWMRVVPAIVAIGVARLLGWIFFPVLSMYALLSGVGIELAVAMVVWFVSCVLAAMFSD